VLCDVLSLAIMADEARWKEQANSAAFLVKRLSARVNEKVYKKALTNG
jgi:hypothetical protein